MAAVLHGVPLGMAVQVKGKIFHNYSIHARYQPKPYTLSGRHPAFLCTQMPNPIDIRYLGKIKSAIPGEKICGTAEHSNYFFNTTKNKKCLAKRSFTITKRLPPSISILLLDSGFRYNMPILCLRRKPGLV